MISTPHQKRLCLAVMLLAGMAVAVQAQNDAEAEPTPVPQPCSSLQYRQFDFWIGEWIVFSDDQTAGTNSVRPILDGCAIQENWRGAGQGGLTGTSFNLYDQANEQWHQTWIDNSGALLELDGGMEGRSMVMRGQRPSRDGASVVSHRISWTPDRDGSVRQLWEARRDGGEWTVLFDGHYQKAR